MKYAVVYEHTPRNYSAYVPDLPGCVATGRTRAEIETRIRRAVELHVAALRKAGERVPPAEAWIELIEA